MRTAWRGILAGVAFGAWMAGAVERKELSPALQAMLPPVGQMVVALKSGGGVTGEVLQQDATQVVVQVQMRGITQTRIFPRAAVASVAPPDIGALVADKLLEFQLVPQRSLAEAEYARTLGLFDEFLKLFPAHPRAAALRERRAAFDGERGKVLLGMEKIDGAWHPPVQAAILRFDKSVAQMEALRKKHPEIEQPGVTTVPAATRKFYEQLRQYRREIARVLPRTMTDRLPQMIQAKNYDEAAAETTAFVQFWLGRVLGAESAEMKGVSDAFKEMDFAYLVKLQQRVLAAWAMEPGAGAATNVVPAATNAESGASVEIPAGYFMMGAADAAITDDRFPAHLVWLDAYRIDKYEVSNAEYRKFVEHVKKTGDSSMEHPGAPPLKDHAPEGWKIPMMAGDDQPVMGVDWFDAYPYAKWAGKRLPTEAEWEKAARSTSDRVYPWAEGAPAQRFVNNPAGRTFAAAEIDVAKPHPPPPKKGMFGGGEPPPPPPPTVLPETTWPVRAALPPEAAAYKIDTQNRDDASPFGLLHMAGNAAEWVADNYDPQAYRKTELRNPQGPAEGAEQVFRGGSYLDVDEVLRVTARGKPAHNDNIRQGLSAAGKPMIGFRCAESIGTPAPAGAATTPAVPAAAPAAVMPTAPVAPPAPALPSRR